MLKQSLLTLSFALAFSTSAFAADCAVDIEGTDTMQFTAKSITIAKTCKDFTINLKHNGKLPKMAMGHNVVISKTADVGAVAADGIAAGLDKDYIKAGDTRIIAHTKLIGPGETATVTFPVSKLNPKESYTFFCSFPGHYGVMKGAIELK